MNDLAPPGRSRLFSNVMAGWLAHTVTLVIGFAMPRLIYESVGQTVLGFWDLGWSLVVYFGYSGLGAGAAVTHYVARHQAKGERALIREATATAWYSQLALALLVAATFMLVFSAAANELPGLDSLAISTIAWMSVLLGATILVALLGDTAQGVLAGCHRHGTGEYVTIGSDITLAIAMIAVLLLGGGVGELAAVTLGTRLVFEMLRLGLARRHCAEMSFRIRDFDRTRAINIFRYGIKTSTGVLQELLVHQLARLALAIAAGPAALACYSRYSTLIRQVSRAVDRMTVVVPPMTSGLVGSGREGDVLGFSLRASNAAILMLLPMIVVFGVFGSDIVEVWMGPEFVVPGLAPVLAIMGLLNGDRFVATGTLSGLNAHGRIALVCLFASMGIFCLGLWFLTPLDPLRAGVLVAVSMGLGVSVPHFVLTCRRLGVTAAKHFRQVYFKPLISNVFFLAFLVWGDGLLHRGNVPLALLVVLTGSLVLAAAYWAFAFDANLRAKVRRRLLRLAH